MRSWLGILIIGSACGSQPATSDAGNLCAASWRVVPVPSATLGNSFAVVGANAAGDAWVCGPRQATVSVMMPVHALHWDGHALTEVSPPRNCDSLWASGPDEVWAGGASLPHHVDHLVGGSWVDVDLGDQRPASTIWGSGPSNVWLGGAGGYWGHWDGVTLTPRAAGGVAATSLWGTGDDDLWAIYGHVYHVDPGAGVSDSFPLTVIFPAGGVSPTAIWAGDDEHVWVVGTGGAIAFFDGKSWSVPPSGTSNDLNGIWGSSDVDVWAVGTAGTILHWNGASWSTVPAPVTANLLAVGGSAACDVWAVGDGGTVLALGL